MKKIIGVASPSSNNHEKFINLVSDWVNSFQKDGQEVEIQFSTNPINDKTNPVVYSALIVGRK